MTTDESRDATAVGSPESQSYQMMEEDISQKEDGMIESPDGTHDFPEGGARAWAVAAGTGGILFCTLGYTNSFGVFQAYYMSNQLQNETTDRIAWIGSLQGFLIFAAGSIGGPLFDRYGAKVRTMTALGTYPLLTWVSPRLFARPLCYTSLQS